MLRKYHIKDYDFKLVLMVVAITIIGILAVGSASAYYQDRFIKGAILGFFLMIVVSLFDYTIIQKFNWLWYAVNIGLLLFVRYFGNDVNNARRWADIFGIPFQPSETAKIILIFFFAQFIMKYRDKINTFKFLVSYVVLCAGPLFLIYKQPDLSTTLVIIVVLCALLLVGGISYKIIAGAFAIAIPSVIVFLSIVLKEGQTLIDNYQRKRILSFIYPEKYADEAYQQVNSVIAIGSGQLFGKGLNNNVISSLKNGKFIIEPQTDFIFAIVGEEMGFVGSCAVILLLFAIVIECILIARKAKDLSGTLICTGIATLIGIQTFFNIGVATFILPNTGLPLPFVSYGLTSLVSMYIGIGFVLNVRLQCKSNRERKEVFL